MTFGRFLAVALLTAPALGQESPEAPGAEPAPVIDHAQTSLTAQQQRQLAIYGPILLNPSEDILADTRRNAAAELLAMGVPQALTILEETLATGPDPSIEAVIHALHDAEQIDPRAASRLTAPAVHAVLRAPAPEVPALATLLPRFGPPALEEVAAATRPGHPAPLRANAIYALGAFRSREAASRLITLLRADAPAGSPAGPPAEPQSDASLTPAIIESLERLTGLAHGRDPDAWIEWWNNAASSTDEQWFEFMAEALSNRVGELQRQIQKKHEAHEQISRELFAAYRDLYPALPIAEQLRRLPRLIGDKLAPVREFALSRVGLLLRDSVRIPADVQEAAATRLNDEVPALRVQAAGLLDELNYANASKLIAARLEVETSPEVAANLLQVLARRPGEAAIAAAQPLLKHASLRDAAADALWAMLPSARNGDAQTAAMCATLRSELQRQDSPALARLLAWTGDETDVASLINRMDDGHVEMRRAIAEALFRRGLRQPLVDRADDDAVYPFAVQAIADGPADLGVFGVLAGLRPAEAHRRVWCDAMIKLASHLPPAHLLAADDMLAALAYADLPLRRAVLLPAANANGDALSGEERVRVAARLAPMLLDLADYALADELLERLPDDAGSAALRPLRFQAAALTGRYDDAARFEPQPANWIALLSGTMKRDRRTAMHLHDEIAQRFQRELSAEERATLDRLGEELRQDAASAATDEAGP